MNSVSAWRSRLLYRDRRSKLNGKTITVQGRLGKLRANMNCDLPWDLQLDENWTEEGEVRVWAMSFSITKQFPIKTIEQSVRCFKKGADFRLQTRYDSLEKTADVEAASLHYHLHFPVGLLAFLFFFLFISLVYCQLIFSCKTRELLCSEYKTFCIQVFVMSLK